jgi:class 3 adenylate cyclase/pimeloyl-ACP methyl ester carboxylesterase
VEPQGIKRKLTTILAADVEGYSRLMSVDEEATLKTLSACRQIIDGLIARHEGRLFGSAGDSVLAEFGSAVEAVRCAIAIQEGVATRNADLPDECKMHYRIGVNLGDVMVEGDNLLGDGVNVAARLEGLAQPGGICISGNIHEHVERKLNLGYEDLGEQELKNIEKPVRVYQVRLKNNASGTEITAKRTALEQEIRFCTTHDGVRIAYATVGQGPPLVKAANWLNHLEFDWQSPVWRHLLEELAKDHLLIRYDERGNGLSDWNVDDISFDAFVRDLEAVVDAVGLERFALLGISQGCAVSIAYTVRHPERVTRLVLHGGYTKGWAKRESHEDIKKREALSTLIRHGWGEENPAFRQVFTSRYLPDSTTEQSQWFNELARISTSPENAVKIYSAMGEIDVRPLVSRVNVPTLVLHSQHEAVVAFEEGREVAASIPGARLVSLESQNHLILEQEPAWPRFLAEVRGFLGTA